MSWASQYVGIPWEAGAQGPDSFDCMGFFRHVQAAHFGVEVPRILAQNYDNPMELAALFIGHEERSRWVRIAEPHNGCAVIIRKPMHIGVWIPDDGGGVLHCARGSGVIFTRDSVWGMSGFGRKEFFERENPQ